MTTEAGVVLPGVYLGITEADYHSDDALSSTMIRKITPPSTPAHLRYHLDHPERRRPSYELGAAVHHAILGHGAPWVIPTDATGTAYPEWRSKDAREQVAAARAAGSVPLKPTDADQVTAMVAALRDHDLAGRLLDLDRGDVASEMSLWWTDPASGLGCRARFDLLRLLPDGRVLAVDYKTAEDAGPGAFARCVRRYGYDQQEAWYRAGAVQVGEPVTEFWFIAQEKCPPYAVACYRIDEDSLARADEWNRAAVDLYADCVASGIWPGYTPDVITVTVPVWAR
jgi:hypothetical protein